jgi:hypothetical protein
VAWPCSLGMQFWPYSSCTHIFRTRRAHIPFLFTGPAFCLCSPSLSKQIIVTSHTDPQKSVTPSDNRQLSPQGVLLIGPPRSMTMQKLLLAGPAWSPCWLLHELGLQIVHRGFCPVLCRPFPCFRGQRW